MPAPWPLARSAGFTGVRVVEHAVRANARRSGTPLRIAAAGRNEAKVRGQSGRHAYPRAQRPLTSGDGHGCAWVPEHAPAALQKQLGADFDASSIAVLYADVIDAASLVAMCSRTRLVINCVGPVRGWAHAAAAHRSATTR